MSLVSVPDEILLLIISQIESLRVLFSLSCVSRRLHAIVEPALFQRDALHSRPYSLAVTWAAQHGMMDLLQKAVHYGAPIPLEAIKKRSPESPLPNPWHWDGSFEGEPHPLTLATEHGHEEIVHFLLMRGCDPKMYHPNSHSLLALAVIARNVSLVETFMGLGVRQQDSGACKHPPMQIAAAGGDGEIMALLVQKIVKERRGPRNVHPHVAKALETALELDHRYLVVQLLDAGVVNDYRALKLALGLGHRHLVLRSLDLGAVNEYSTLYSAVLERDLDFITTILNRPGRETKHFQVYRPVNPEDVAIVDILREHGVECIYFPE